MSAWQNPLNQWTLTRFFIFHRIFVITIFEDKKSLSLQRTFRWYFEYNMFHFHRNILIFKASGWLTVRMNESLCAFALRTISETVKKCIVQFISNKTKLFAWLTFNAMASRVKCCKNCHSYSLYRRIRHKI